MDKEKLLKIIEQFKNKKVLVIGDVMLDKYIVGDVSRISPEAPVQVVKVTSEGFAPGGAANVANNLSALGGSSFMVGIVGKDNTRDILFREFTRRNINVDGIFNDETKPTIQKVRILAMGQQLLRVDYEKVDGANELIGGKIIDFVNQKINEIDAVIVSDYAKGVVTEKLMKNLTELVKNKNKILVVDPKPKHMALYQGATLITPNHKEASSMVGIEVKSDEDMVKVGNKLLEKLNSAILITKGEKGMSLFEKDGGVTHIPTKAKEVYDVTGAGDTVAAALTLALASGATTKEAAIIANHAAGITVGKVGTSAVSVEEIKESLENE
ncbi:D-glycero-beta-D-manno-heptose-7-phosphate kinase [Candidatus Woesearchaeota archaeon]|nr:D-glycero-beta-D-manno-heptose-7-phosphate kinase [Candidatus Woesearchaeota archaeon]